MENKNSHGALSELPIQPLQLSDIAQCLRLSEEAGWNQSAADWRLLLSGIGIGVFDQSSGDRGLVATAILFPYPPSSAWVSMVLVQKNWRRRGLATRLLTCCIEEARKRGLTPILDATEEGRPVYRNLGFEDCFAITRLERAAGFLADASMKNPQSVPRTRERVDAESKASAGLEFTIRPIAPADMADLAHWDSLHFGTSRQHVLESLYQQSPIQSRIAFGPDGQMIGYGLCREGRLAQQIGPVVAMRESAAWDLIQDVLAAIQNNLPDPKSANTIIDVPDEHEGLQHWLESVGFIRRRRFMRMQLRGAGPLRLAASCFAIGGPEIG